MLEKLHEFFFYIQIIKTNKQREEMILNIFLLIDVDRRSDNDLIVLPIGLNSMPIANCNIDHYSPQFH